MFKLFKKQSNELEVTVSNKTIIRVIALIIAASIIVSAVRVAQHALILIFIAFFLTLALNAPVHWLAQHLPGKRKGDRSIATAVSFALVIGFLVAFLASIVPPLVSQTTQFIDAAPGIVRDARNGNSTVGRLIQRYHLEDEIESATDDVSSRLQSATGQAFGTLARIGSSVFSTLTVLVMTFMMLIEGPRWLTFARRLIPSEHEAHAAKLALKMYKVVKGYVNGQVILAAMAAVFIVIPLLILKVGNPIALMLVIFICGLIPMVGHTIGALIVSTVALFESPLAALIVLAYYILYQQIENYVVQPRVQANSTDMSPLLVFASVVIGVSFNGLLGGLVAIPVAGCLRVLFLDYLQHRRILSPHDVARRTAPTNTKGDVATADEV